MKKCSACGDWKELSEFHKDKTQKDGHCRVCKLCKNAAGRKYYADNADLISERTKEYYEANPQKKADRYQRVKEWRGANPEKMAEHRGRHYEAHGERLRKKSAEYYEANKERRIEQMQEYYKTNPEKFAEYRKKYREECEEWEEWREAWRNANPEESVKK